MLDNIDIVPMSEQHIDDVIEIDKSYSTKPWNREIFFQELRNNFSYNFSVLYNKKIIGFANFWLVFDVIELNNFAIKKEFRNKGIGKRFLQFIFKAGELLKAKKIFLEVKSDNLVAYDMYKKLGFRDIGIRKKYYSDGKDAILLEKILV